MISDETKAHRLLLLPAPDTEANSIPTKKTPYIPHPHNFDHLVDTNEELDSHIQLLEQHVKIIESHQQKNKKTKTKEVYFDKDGAVCDQPTNGGICSNTYSTIDDYMQFESETECVDANEELNDLLSFLEPGKENAINANEETRGVMKEGTLVVGTLKDAPSAFLGESDSFQDFFGVGM